MENIVSEEVQKSIFVQLPPDGELSIVVPNDELNTSTIRLEIAPTDQRVDIMGCPMMPDVKYSLLAGQVFTIFAWSTSTIEIKGSPSLLKNVFRSPKSNIRALVEYHCLLHARRVDAEKARTTGPMVLICGNSAGKHGIPRTLCSYAARSGWKPLLVDLDNSVLQSVCTPGSIGCAVVEYPIVVDEVVSQTHFSLSYFVGSLECQKTQDASASMSPAFVNYSTVLLDSVQQRLQYHAGSTHSCSGAIIALPELQGLAGANYMIDMIERYAVSNVLCIGDDYIFHKLHSRFSGNDRVRVDAISPNFLGYVDWPLETSLPGRFKQYFNGDGTIIINPAQWTQPLDRIEVFQIYDEAGKVSLVTVEREALQGVVGCIAGLFVFNRSQTLLSSPPLTLAKINAVDASGIHLLTTTHSPPNEKLCAVVGSVRWLSS